jgi:hypothetical protein
MVCFDRHLQVFILGDLDQCCSDRFFGSLGLWNLKKNLIGHSLVGSRQLEGDAGSM